MRRRRQLRTAAESGCTPTVGSCGANTTSGARGCLPRPPAAPKPSSTRSSGPPSPGTIQDHEEDVRRRSLPRALVALIAVRLLWNIASDEGMSWDFINFYNAGERIVHWRIAELYRAPRPIGGGEIGPGRLDYVGVPISAILFAPFGGLPGRAALVALKTACALAFGLGLIVVYRYGGDRCGSLWSPDVALTLYLLLILFFEPFWFVFTIGGQATPFIFLLLALLVPLYTEGRAGPAAICLSAAILLKP